MNKSENWINEIAKEYGSLEKYIAESLANHADPLLYGVKPFTYLYKKGFLIEGDFIRTNTEGGVVDRHYAVTKKGKLEGVEAAGGAYSGPPGIHEPKKALSLTKADRGWTLGTYSQLRIRRSIEKT